MYVNTDRELTIYFKNMIMAVKKLSFIFILLFISALFVGCVEKEEENTGVNIREYMRVDMPELIVDHVNNTTKIYLIGVEKYRYPELSLWVDGIEVENEINSLVLVYTTEKRSLNITAVAKSLKETYLYECSIDIMENGIKIKDYKGEKIIKNDNLPHEIALEAVE